MTPENRNIPDWARRERQADTTWISENIGVFWAAAAAAFEDAGRGAIVVDTTLEPIPGAGNPFAYFSQDQVQGQGDGDIARMVSEYDPTHEVVLVLLKSGNRTSTYRVCTNAQERQGPVGSELAASRTRKQTAELKLVPPDVETLIAWESEGGCEAACPNHCWVEPDGTCRHGNPSWLLQMGMI